MTATTENDAAGITVPARVPLPGSVGGTHAEYPEPLWLQAVAGIRSDIDSGILRLGMRLAPERELCLSLGISRVTLRKALAHLVSDGILTASHGRGWYVAAPTLRKEWPNSLESFSETAARMGLVAHSQVTRALEAPATLDEGEELGIAPGTPLFHLDRIRLLDDVPIAFDVTRFASSLAPGVLTQDFTEDSLYESLSRAGVEPARADSTIEAREADATVAAYLGLNVGTPVLALQQVAVDAADRPLFASRIIYAGDRYRLRTTFARSSGHPPWR
jgi:GntR family transcriptional regulator